jgi:RNA polymerase sigma-70 factor (ECF subfamily)
VAAFDALLVGRLDRCYRLAWSILANDADAADATQDALMAAVRGLPRFDGQASFSTWVYRVATNTCLDHLRRRRRRPAVAFDDHGDDVEHRSVPAPAFDVAVADRLAIDQALALLPEEFRVAVVLRDVADLDYAEIAGALGIPIGTVRSRIARGRAALARQLGNRPAAGERPTSADE